MSNQPNRLAGIIPPMITPLLDPDRLDVAGLERLVEHILAGGVHGLFLLGTTGEGPSLSYRLREELVARACVLVDGRVPVLVGVTDTSLAESVALASHAAESGAQAVVLAPPPYFPTGPGDLRQYVGTAVRRMDLPVFLYNMPSHTKVAYDLDTVRGAMELPGVVGIKDSSGDAAYLKRLCRLPRRRPDFSVLVGPELLLADAIRFGADGGVCGGANLAPGLLVAVYDAAVAERDDLLTPLQRRLAELDALYRFDDNSMGVIKGLKAALERLGICSGALAEPLHPLPPSHLEQLHAALAAMPALRACHDSSTAIMVSQRGPQFGRPKDGAVRVR